MSFLKKKPWDTLQRILFAQGLQTNITQYTIQREFALISFIALILFCSQLYVKQNRKYVFTLFQTAN